MLRGWTNRYTALVLCTCVLAVAAGGCGDDSTGHAGTGGAGGGGATGGDSGSSGAGGGSTATCPTLAESWRITEHCTVGFAGEQIPFTQTECALVVGGAFSGLEGAVGENGEIALSGALGVMPYACDGTATESEMTLTCTTDCVVRLLAE